MASILQVGKKWRALIRRKGLSKPICKTFKFKAEAEAWAREVENQVDKGSTPSASRLDVADLVTTYRGLREHSRPILDTSNEHYQLRRIEAELGHLTLDELSIDALVAWARARKDDGAGPYTVNMDISKLGTVIRYACAMKRMLAPDVVGSARPLLAHLGLIGGGGRRERRPTQEELDALEMVLPEHWWAVVRFAVRTAMRRGEIFNLRWDDLDEEKRLVCIRDRKHPRKKEGNDQWIPLLTYAWDIVQAQPRISDRIFPYHVQTCSKVFKACCDSLSIPDLHFHDLRHEGASRLFEEGYSTQEVAVITGHMDWRHLKRYTNLRPESLHRPVA